MVAEEEVHGFCVDKVVHDTVLNYVTQEVDFMEESVFAIKSFLQLEESKGRVDEVQRRPGKV